MDYQTARNMVFADRERYSHEPITSGDAVYVWRDRYHKPIALTPEQAAEFNAEYTRNDAARNRYLAAFKAFLEASDRAAVAFVGVHSYQHFSGVAGELEALAATLRKCADDCAKSADAIDALGDRIAAEAGHK